MNESDLHSAALFPFTPRWGRGEIRIREMKMRGEQTGTLQLEQSKHPLFIFRFPIIEACRRCGCLASLLPSLFRHGVLCIRSTPLFRDRHFLVHGVFALRLRGLEA